MKRLIALAVFLMFTVPFIHAPVFAAERKTQIGITDVGNKFCPVSGDPVSGTNFVIYQGKRYGLCCPMCEKPFLASPAKYIAKSEAQEKAAQVSGTVPVSTMGGVAMDMGTQAPAEEHERHNM